MGGCRLIGRGSSGISTRLRARSFGIFRKKNVFRTRKVFRLPNERLFLIFWIFWCTCFLLHEKSADVFRLATLATKTAVLEKWQDLFSFSLRSFSEAIVSIHFLILLLFFLRESFLLLQRTLNSLTCSRSFQHKCHLFFIPVVLFRFL